MPELVRVATAGSCELDLVPEIAAELEDLAGRGNSMGDITADCGYSLRVAGNWAHWVRGAPGAGPLRGLLTVLVVFVHRFRFNPYRLLVFPYTTPDVVVHALEARITLLSVS